MLIKCNKIISATTKKILTESPWVKIGKIYTVLAIEYTSSRGISVLIQTENDNQPIFKSLDGFEVITQAQPKSWITKVEKVYDMDVMTRLPKAWDYKSFFEDLDDQNPEAIELFRQEAIKIYDEEGYPDVAPRN